MPHTNFSGRRQRDQLAANEEQVFYTHVQIKRAHVDLDPFLGYAPESYLTAIRDCDHFTIRATSHLRVYRHALYYALDMRTGEHVLPSGRVFQSVARNEMRVSDHYPVVMRLYNLHSQRIHP